MKKNIFRILSLLLAVSFLTSCLKDDRLVLDPEKGNNVIEFANPTQIATIGSVYPLYVMSYDLNPTVTVPITLSYSGPESGAPQDITVNFGVGTEADVTAYNTDQDEHFTFMPAEDYTLGSTSAVIKKGQSKATFNITFKLESFDLSESLVLPLVITSSSSGIISGNFNKILLNVGAKNRIDGLYSYKTSATTSLVPNADFSGVPLVTAGARTVTTNLLDTYANIVTYDIDPVTNKVTVVSVVNPLGVIATDPISNYNPATKVMYVKWTSNGGARTFEETFTFTGSR
jgi:hypothetical protein